MRIALTFVALLGCSTSDLGVTPPQPTTEMKTASGKAKDPAAARALIAKGATVIDVRTTEEFADGHVPSATNIPVQSFGAHLGDVDKLVGGDKTKPVVLYCGVGARAAKAKTALEAAGYTNVVNGGGLDDLQ